MPENPPDSIKNGSITVQQQLNETAKQILGSPESPADLFVTGSALIAFLIAASYLIRFFRKLGK